MRIRSKFNIGSARLDCLLLSLITQQVYYSEPEPDLAVVRGQVLDYLDHHPQSTEVQLVVEVADTTLKRDCEVKEKVYARAGIADYWVLDVGNRRLYLFREPTPMGYASHRILTEPASLSPLAFPDISIQLSEILPPVL